MPCLIESYHPSSCREVQQQVQPKRICPEIKDCQLSMFLQLGGFVSNLAFPHAKIPNELQKVQLACSWPVLGIEPW